VRSSPRGYAPDWVLYRASGGFQPDAESKAIGSYNAIRVYLWAGMMAADDPVRAVLLKTFAPVAQHVAREGTPPLEIDTRQGSNNGVGSPGFSAALLPFLAASKQDAALQQQTLRIDAKSPLERSDNYYDQALALFGLGWIEGRYRFARDGALILRSSCAAS
jgi:endoglucanase